MRALLALLAALLLAGCAGPSDDSVAPAGNDAPATPSPVATPTPAPEPAVEPQGAEGDDSDISRPPEPRIVRVDAEVKAPASVGHPCLGPVYPPCGRGPSEPGTLVVAEGGPAAARLTVWWNATAPAATTRWVELAADGGSLASAQGESPLVLEVPIEHLQEPVELWGRFTAAAGGVAVNEAAHFVLELTYR